MDSLLPFHFLLLLYATEAPILVDILCVCVRARVCDGILTGVGGGDGRLSGGQAINIKKDCACLYPR